MQKRRRLRHRQGSLAGKARLAAEAKQKTSGAKLTFRIFDPTGSSKRRSYLKAWNFRGVGELSSCALHGSTFAVVNVALVMVEASMAQERPRSAPRHAAITEAPGANFATGIELDFEEPD